MSVFIVINARNFFIQEKTAARVDQDDNEEDDFRAQEAQDILDDLIQSKDKNNGMFNLALIVLIIRC